MKQPMEQPVEEPIEEAIEAKAPLRRLYSEEDVRAILERAVGAKGNTFTREDLEEMAEELGVSPKQLEAAEESWVVERLDKDEREAFITYRRQQAIKGVVGVVTSGIIAYLAYFSDFLFFPILATIAGFLIFFVALGVISDLYDAYFSTEGEEFEDEYDLWLEERNKLRLRAEERRQKMLGR
ncbi:MAG: hypothetical protein ACPGWR_04355 [Ardenticatenaceae bacterium]